MSMHHSHTVKISTALSAIVILLLIGTVIFHALEGWNWIDSFYFTGVTLTTVGYGDLAPTLPLTKVLTVLFAFVGISIVLFTMTIFAKIYLELGQEKISSEVRSLKHKIKGRKVKGAFGYSYRPRLNLDIFKRLKIPKFRLRKSI